MMPAKDQNKAKKGVGVVSGRRDSLRLLWRLVYTRIKGIMRPVLIVSWQSLVDVDLNNNRKERNLSTHKHSSLLWSVDF